ncbi:MAG: hypothetical protein AABW92_06010 [Nanoarchaeota archaeon]
MHTLVLYDQNRPFLTGIITNNGKYIVGLSGLNNFADDAITLLGARTREYDREYKPEPPFRTQNPQAFKDVRSLFTYRPDNDR